MDKRTKHQESIIRNYYKNQDVLALQKLSEHVSELFLAEGKARQQRWKFIVIALEKLNIPKTRIEHLRKQDDATLLAKLIEELMAKK